MKKGFDPTSSKRKVRGHQAWFGDGQEEEMPAHRTPEG